MPRLPQFQTIFLILLTYFQILSLRKITENIRNKWYFQQQKHQLVELRNHLEKPSAFNRVDNQIYEAQMSYQSSKLQLKGL